MPRPLRLTLAAAVALLTLAALVWLASAWYSSRLPATYSVMDYAVADYGGGSRPVSSHEHDHHGGQSGVSVATLRGPRTGGPIVRFRLTAKHATIRLASGRTIEALTFNGRSPGPELRVHEGDLVEVTLFNKDVEDGVTIHWHGVDVPDAEDGVAGVTQDAVEPGQSYTYRFLASQVGTFWYHTHQDSAEDVKRGLYGAFVIEPAEPVPAHTLDLALVAHVFDGVQTLNASDGVERRVVAPGTPVRLRLINSDNNPQRFTRGRHALQGRRHRRHGLERTFAARREDARARRRWALRHRLHDARDTGRPRDRRHGRQARTEQRRKGVTPGGTRGGDIRSVFLRRAGIDTLRRLEPVRPHVRARDRDTSRAF